MKKISISLLCISCIFLMANWAKQTSEISGGKRQRINFYGTIVTVGNQDKQTKINNISITDIYKQIPVYVAPTTFTKHINTKTHVITANPKDILQQIRIDLSEIKTIQTRRIEGNPVVWEYKSKPCPGRKSSMKREFIELIVTANDNTKNNYLIEIRKSLNFNVINPAGPMESKINFKGLEKLNIEGYIDRELQKKEALQKIRKLRKKPKPKEGINHKYKKGIPSK